MCRLLLLLLLLLACAIPSESLLPIMGGGGWTRPSPSPSTIPSKVRKGDAQEEEKEEPTHVHHTGNVFQSVFGCWMYVGEIRKTEDLLAVA